MKKFLAILLCLALTLGLASSALALSWNAASVSDTASPFAVEVIKLTANADVTGSKYYTVLNDAAAYSFSTLYYAIKLTLPSYSDANAYYGTSDLKSGSLVKVTITYTNIDGKSKDVVNVALKSTSQTLWYNGSEFEASWVTALNNSCGCGSSHILSATSTGTAGSTIKACVVGKGVLSDISIDGCYTVSSETLYGVKPCSKCDPVNMTGYRIQGSCSAYGVFFRTNSAGKVVNIYVYDRCSPEYQTTVDTFAQITKPLYRWEMTGSTTYCTADRCTHATYDLVELSSGLAFSQNGYLEAGTGLGRYGLADSDGYFAAYLYEASVATRLLRGGSIGTGDDTFASVYYVDDDGLYQLVTGNEDFWKLSASNGVYYSKGVKSGYTDTTAADSDGKYFQYNTASYGGSMLVYGSVYYMVAGSSDTIAELYELTSATTVNCDGNEKSYLNVANYVMALLGFTYADFAAGNVYMTDDNWLTNFGFASGSCGEASWNAYTASITVAEVAEVPATGSVSLAGFAMLALAVAAAAAWKRARA